MQNIAISIIIPFFNAKKFLPICLNNLSNINFKEKFEIILINDGSSDNSEKIVKNFSKIKLRLYSLPKNMGPGAARNLGIKKARGQYIFFLDVDDILDKNILSELYNKATKNKIDLIFCDRKWIENNKNLRKNKFAFPKNKIFNLTNIKKAMDRRFYDPLTAVGLFQTTGRLIKRSIIVKNRIKFEKKLRYLEDEAFEWDLLGYLKKIVYVHQQLYSYHLHNNINTGLSQGISNNFPISNFRIVKKHVEKSLLNKKFQKNKIKKIGNQGYIFLIVSSLISLSRSILLGKINKTKGLKKRDILIKNILLDNKVEMAVKNYKISKKESTEIIEAIKLKDSSLLKQACNIRAKKILNLRRREN